MDEDLEEKRKGKRGNKEEKMPEKGKGEGANKKLAMREKEEIRTRKWERRKRKMGE
jgi:hypothetical protein